MKGIETFKPRVVSKHRSSPSHLGHILAEYHVLGLTWTLVLNICYSFVKGNWIWCQPHVIILLTGTLSLIHVDYWGERQNQYICTAMKILWATNICFTELIQQNVSVCPDIRNTQRKLDIMPNKTTIRRNKKYIVMAFMLLSRTQELGELHLAFVVWSESCWLWVHNKATPAACVQQGWKHGVVNGPEETEMDFPSNCSLARTFHTVWTGN